MLPAEPHVSLPIAPFVHCMGLTPATSIRSGVPPTTRLEISAYSAQAATPIPPPRTPSVPVQPVLSRSFTISPVMATTSPTRDRVDLQAPIPRPMQHLKHLLLTETRSTRSTSIPAIATGTTGLLQGCQKGVLHRGPTW